MPGSWRWGSLTPYHDGLFSLGTPKHVAQDDRTRYMEKVFYGNAWDNGEKMERELATKLADKPGSDKAPFVTPRVGTSKPANEKK